jgi:carbamoyl-phosphate synthase large subunit
MRTASLKIINALGIEGGCNVQMALNPEGFDYYIIEVNPRVSRSSALASKATGYPIARVAAKIAIGLTLDKIDNQVTGSTKACFEPALDYCVVKIPRWPFDKFASGDRSLFTQMKATGEVMAIDRSFEAALMKAIRGLEVKQKDLRHVKYQTLSSDADLREAIRKPTDERLWALADGLRRGWSVEEINRISRVDTWFLRKIKKLIECEQKLVASRGNADAIPGAVQEAFYLGYPSSTIKELLGVSEDELSAARKILRGHADGSDQDRYAAVIAETGEVLEAFASIDKAKTATAVRPSTANASLTAALAIERLKIQPVFKMVDTCAGEFESQTPYYYSTFDQEDDAIDRR